MHEKVNKANVFYAAHLNELLAYEGCLKACYDYSFSATTSN